MSIEAILIIASFLSRDILVTNMIMKMTVIGLYFVGR